MVLVLQPQDQEEMVQIMLHFFQGYLLVRQQEMLQEVEVEVHIKLPHHYKEQVELEEEQMQEHLEHQLQLKTELQILEEVEEQIVTLQQELVQVEAV